MRLTDPGDAGKIEPVKFEWLHREHDVESVKTRLNVEITETSEILMNGVGFEEN